MTRWMTYVYNIATWNAAMPIKHRMDSHYEHCQQGNMIIVTNCSHCLRLAVILPVGSLPGLFTLQLTIKHNFGHIQPLKHLHKWFNTLHWLTWLNRLNSSAWTLNNVFPCWMFSLVTVDPFIWNYYSWIQLMPSLGMSIICCMPPYRFHSSSLNLVDYHTHKLDQGIALLCFIQGLEQNVNFEFSTIGNNCEITRQH